MNFSSLLSGFGRTSAKTQEGADEFLQFFDTTKQLCFGYCVHRTGSLKMAEALCQRVYAAALSKELSFLWFGALNMALLLKLIEAELPALETQEAELEKIFTPKLAFLSPTEKGEAGHLHEALWSLPVPVQQILILSYLCGESIEHVAAHLRVSVAIVEAHLKEATGLLLQTWQHSPAIEQKLSSLTVLPSLATKDDEEIRSLLLTQWTQLKMRRTQWVVIGGILAVFSNVVVAGVLAFVVVTQPTTSIRSSSLQVASFDAILVQRELKRIEADTALAESFKTAQGLAAYDAARKLTELGLSPARESLEIQQKNNAQMQKVIKLLKTSSTAIRSTQYLQIARE